MHPINRFILFFCGLILFLSCDAQVNDSALQHFSNAAILSMPPHPYTGIEKKSLPVKSLIIPGIMVLYGVGSIENHKLKSWNRELKYEIYTEHPHQIFPLDNYLQFAPAAAVYGLNAMGIKGKHNLKDRTMIYLMSNVLLNVTVFSAKRISHETRPDGSDNYSFPSGHTAEAFASAEFLRQEYKDVSMWYGVAGYAAAAATGYFRMYNNKHWFSDVVAGAGVGIMSTKLAYWLYPTIQHSFSKNKPAHTIVMPTWQNGAFGFAMAHSF